MTFRSREILNADTIVGQLRLQQQHDLQLRGRRSAAARLNSSTGFDVASFLLGYATTKNRNLFDADTYTEKRPEWSLYVQDDFRVTCKLTLNLGLRWDVYVPWVEIDDRQSNFDETTGQFVVASDNATLGGVQVGRYLQTYSKGDLGPRFGFAYDVSGNGRTIVRGGVGVFWNFTPGGTSSSKAQNPPFLQSTALTATPNTNFSATKPARLGRPAAAAGRRPHRPARIGHHALDLRRRLPRRLHASTGTSTSSSSSARTTWSSSPTSGSRGRQYLLKGDPNQAPATVGVTNSNVNRPYATLPRPCARSGRCRARGSSTTTALLVKFQRRFANGFSLLNSYTLAKAQRLNSDNDGTVTVTNVYDIAGYNRGPADYDIKHTLSVDRDRTSCPSGATKRCGRLAGERHRLLRAPATRSPSTQTQGILSTTPGGTGQRPNVVGNWAARQPDDRQVVRADRVPAAGRHHRHLRRRRPQHHARARSSSTSTCR